jgi:hypothetical protein
MHDQSRITADGFELENPSVTAMLDDGEQAGIVGVGKIPTAELGTGFREVDFSVRRNGNIVRVNALAGCPLLEQQRYISARRYGLQAKLRIRDEQIAVAVEFDTERATAGMCKNIDAATVPAHANDVAAERARINEIAALGVVLVSLVCAELVESCSFVAIVGL